MNKFYGLRENKKSSQLVLDLNFIFFPFIPSWVAGEVLYKPKNGTYVYNRRAIQGQQREDVYKFSSKSYNLKETEELRSKVHT